jgi:membrane dipeptidase
MSRQRVGREDVHDSTSVCSPRSPVDKHAFTYNITRVFQQLAKKRESLAAGMRSQYTRRSLLRSAAYAGAATLAFPMLNLGRHAVAADSAKKYSTRAIDLVKSTQCIDLKHALTLHPDVLKSWLTDVTAFGAQERALFRRTGLKIIQTTLETVPDTLLDYGWHNGFVAAHDDLFYRVDAVDELTQARTDGRIGIIFGSENSDHFATLDDVNRYYSLGQRVSQLTYNSQNRLGSGSTDRIDGGLSDYGAAITERMNKVGMAVDLSHCGPRTTLDAIAASQKPVLFTHATTRALNPAHPRTKTDEAITKLAAGGGVMGIAFLRVFATSSEPTTIEHVLDHFDHVARLVGVEHLAVGSDIALYGYDSLPRALVEASKANLKPGSYAFREKDDVEDLAHPERLYDLAEGLIRRKYSDRDIGLVLGGNAARVLQQIWRV